MYLLRFLSSALGARVSFDFQLSFKEASYIFGFYKGASLSTVFELQLGPVHPFERGKYIHLKFSSSAKMQCIFLINICCARKHVYLG